MDIKDARCKRAEPDSPTRCQSVTAQGQCALEAMPGSIYCIAHGGHSVITRENKESMRNYRLTKWRDRIHNHADSTQVKSIREEIGILRILLEERLNTCNTSAELMLNSQAIGDLVTKIEHVVTSCHKLESQMGQLLDKQAIIKFAARVVEIITSIIDGFLVDGTLTEELATLISSSIADALIASMSDLETLPSDPPSSE